MMKLKIGFSTGVLSDTHDTKSALLELKNIGAKYVELGFVRVERMEGWLRTVTKDDVAPFSYVSFHAPKIVYGRNTETERILSEIVNFHIRIRALDLVVIHPDFIEDAAVLTLSGLPIGIENMDYRKMSFKTPATLEPLFRQFPDWKLVLDMNHIWTNDPTMALANNFFQQFSDRLAEIHVSGYRTLHDPLYQTQQREIIEAIQRLDVPLIEESGLSVDGLEKERTYLTEVISQRTDLV